MRIWLLAFLFIPLAPLAVAAEDTLGDQEVGIRYLSVDYEEQIHWLPANPAGWYPEVDMVAGSVSETQDHVIFEVSWADNKPNDPTSPAELVFVYYRFEFNLRGEPMVGLFERFMWDDSGDFDMFRIGMEEEGGYQGFRYTASWPAERPDDKTLRVEFPKRYFVDDQYVPLRQGDRLEDIQLTSSNDDWSFGRIPTIGCPYVYTDPTPFVSPGNCDVRVRDTMDSNLEDLPIELQGAGVGHLMMRSDKPWRLSNGLATTYLFEVDLHNFDDAADEVVLAATNVPKGWEVLHPARITFKDAGVETIPIAVTVPFIHEHGARAAVTISGVSERAPASAVGTDLGVFYADPAQPGGHHPTLFFHSYDFGFGSAWMNTDPTISEQEGTRTGAYFDGEQVGIPGSIQLNVPTEATWEWRVRTTPSIQTGLDFDLASTIQAKVDFELPADLQATVTASLVIENGAEPLIVAEMTSDQIDFTGGQGKEVTLTGKPNPEADRIEAGSGNMYLYLSVSGTPTEPQIAQLAVNNQAFFVTENSRMTLPLFDFHEQVDLSGLELNAYTLLGERTFAELNPGKTAAFVFNVTNLLSEQASIDWSLTGQNAAWGDVVPAVTAIAGDGQGRVVVRVQPPATAKEGDTAELLLMGTDDDERQVFVRMTAYVTTQEDIPDESAVAEAAADEVATQNKDLEKDSPGFEVVAILALVAAVAALIRRRE